ncbi:hypothetical protein DCS32_11680 [Dokdonia sp. Dokd-P16]|uniref:hypothetical protein n=1 Tax=Dokdonia sp. Dokd-P16 TaxID=2173169 RepID=UPI000D54A5CC|nr:hypothetical protein [Dokdonia sp. Dokd-P16]AWH74793.1 hypothetical protein DCS32_11680 [Dokdonia sp. Dokd-P16]
MKNILKSDTLTNLLWAAFGAVGALNYYAEEKYLICSLLILIAVLYAYKLFKSVTNNRKIKE